MSHAPVLSLALSPVLVLLLAVVLVLVTVAQVDNLRYISVAWALDVGYWIFSVPFA
jgi:hypothetical protein